MTGLLLGPPPVDTKALMRRHRAALSLFPDTDETERVRLLTIVVAPRAGLLEAIEGIEERLADHDTANYSLGR